MTTNSKGLPKGLITTLIIFASALVIYFVMSNPPTNKRFGGAKQAQLVVDVIELKAQPYRVDVASYGVVQPRTQSALIAQVSGQVNYISESLRDGSFFAKGQLLLSIDERDYAAEVKIAEAGLLAAKQALIEEEARAEQAKIDWQRLGSGDVPSDLVLRKPQLAAQKANALSAQAKLNKAKLNLERTRIVAPFTGRVLSKKVDLGQVISMNTQVAEIFATDTVEIRLPINNKDLAFIDLPEIYQTGEKVNQDNVVSFHSDLIGEQFWQGKLVRTEGAINNSSQQLYVVAQISDPYSAPINNQSQIKIGQYVNAQIKGKTLPDALTIPNDAIYQGAYVYVLTEQNTLLRKDVEIAWQGQTESLIAAGLNNKERLVVTPLGQVSSGTRVMVMGEQNLSKRQGKPNREALEAIAKKRGISIEQLIAERKQKRENKAKEQSL